VAGHVNGGVPAGEIHAGDDLLAPHQLVVRILHMAPPAPGVLGINAARHAKHEPHDRLSRDSVPNLNLVRQK